MYSTPKRRNPALFIVILLLHLCLLFMLNLPVQKASKNAQNRTQLVFLSAAKSVVQPTLENRVPPTLDKSHTPVSHTAIKPKTSAISVTNNTPTADSPTVDKPSNDSVPAAPTPLPLDRNVKQLTQQLERELRFDKQKEEAAKPPNQVAREYWEKQNHPYKDKWEELAHKIEQAGVARDPKVETFKAQDGTQITKIGNRCYKSPDPGRTYLHQPEVRQVICTR